MISRAGYNYFQYTRVDYLSPLGRWGIYPISGRARKVQNYLTLMKPFDEYTWAWVAASASAVIAALACTDYYLALRKNLSTRGILSNSKANNRMQ